jgi:hypothetical protein
MEVKTDWKNPECVAGWILFIIVWPFTLYLTIADFKDGNLTWRK